MNEKRSKKLYKLPFLRNLRKYRTDIKINGMKMMDGDSPRSNIGCIACPCHCTKGVEGAKIDLNCDFRNTAEAKNLKLGTVVIYKI